MESASAGLVGGVPVARDLKDLLALERKEIEALHRGGALGVQVSSALTDLYDRVISCAWQGAVERLPADLRARALRELALVAVGGYGRQDVAPFSDVDLLFLTARRPHPAILNLVSALVRDLWDIGLKLAHSVRPAPHCISAARGDLTLKTALLEARLLAGGPALFADLERRVHRLMGSSLNRFIDALRAERAREHQDYFAATVYLLEPNVKKSPGGLRDVHLLRWIAFPRYGTRDPEMLRVGGVLTAEDAHTLADAQEFLARVRNELHYAAGVAQDVLTRDEQVRMAQWLGFENQGPLLGVERFMRHYYRHTTALHDLVTRFADGARRRSLPGRLLQRLLTSRVESHFLVDRKQIAIDPAADGRVLRSAETLVRLVDLARHHGVAVAPETLERVRAAAPACEITGAARRRFLDLMADPNGLGTALRYLHRVGLLGRLVPAFEHARCLMQFNQYHKYTVDEHSIRAVEAAIWREKDAGPVGQAYRETRRKDVLHLAVLLHDVGKGLERDHSEEGKRIAEETAALLEIPDPERNLLVFLVHQHLLMAHAGLRRDVSDEKTVLQFVRQVGTLEALRMLYVLTVADTEAVAPGSLTGWKESLLEELYLRSAEALSGAAAVADEGERARKIRTGLLEKLKGEFAPDWLAEQLEAMPLPYLLSTAPEAVTAHLRIQRTLDPAGVRVVAEYDRGTGLSTYSVLLRDDITPGIFSKIAGVLAAERFQIVGARIVTRADGFIVDTFEGIDLDFKGEPPPVRREEVSQRIEDVLLGRLTVEQLFERRPAPRRAPGASKAGPTQVTVDTSSSDRFTVVEVFADDRQGLLYVITNALFELGFSVGSARISTRLDQAVDVFYVADRETGAKVTDEARLEGVRRRLVELIDAP